jgi:hypothetical protein
MLKTIVGPYRIFILLLVCLPVLATALTRWSSLHTIPDADFLESWNYVLDYQGYYFNDSADGAVLKNSGLGQLGLSEWSSVSGGYAGGMTLGLKVKVLSENASIRPSLALGAHNILKHTEDHRYNHDSAAWSNEFYMAAGKSIEPIKLRLHAGVQTMPDVKKEKVTFFFALEKYLGSMAYITLETMYRDEKMRPSLFASVRFFQKHVELSGGAVDLLGMFAKSKAAAAAPDLVRPGYWFGLRVMGNMTSPNRTAGFSSLEEQIAYQREMIIAMKRDVDSLKRTQAGQSMIVDSLNKNFSMVADSALGATSGQRLRNFALERLVKLNTLFSQENIDAEQIRTVAREILGYGDIMVPVLKYLVLDPQIDRAVHVQAMTRLGEIGTAQAANAVIDILPQTQDPDVRIEGLIAIGAMKDHRAAYLIEQLASDPNEAVAFTATEVLLKLENRKPLAIDSLSLKPSLPSAIPDKKISPTTIPSSTPVMKEAASAVKPQTESPKGKAAATEPAPAGKNTAKKTETPAKKKTVPAAQEQL